MDLIPMFPLLQKAREKHYAQGAFNVTSFQQVKAVLDIHEALRSPALVQVGNMALGYFGGAPELGKSSLEERRKGAKNVVSMMRRAGAGLTIPAALHADHVKDLETIKILIEEGFTSVMIDGSALGFDENVAITKQVVDYAHPRGVTVEGELGVLAGVEDDMFSKNSTYTNPMKVVEFVKRTGADCLALSYGTKHGLKKGTNVKLRKEIVIAAMENMRHEGVEAALVSHGSSTVPAYVIEDVNALGGKMGDAGGVPIGELVEIIRLGISKVNIDTDLRLCITRNIREYLSRSPVRDSDPLLARIWPLMEQNASEVDFRLYLDPVKDYLLDGSLVPGGVTAEIMDCMTRGIYEIVSKLIVDFGSIGYANRIARTSLEEMIGVYAGRAAK